jgi:hypothetical protein
MTTFRIGWGTLVFARAAWAQQYLISTIAAGAPPPTPAPGLTLIGPPVGMAKDGAGNAYFMNVNCVFKPGTD